MKSLKPKVSLLETRRSPPPGTPRLGASKTKTARDRMLAAEPWCRTCRAKGVYTIATEVDHIVPLARGGAESDENRQPLCSDCHKEKTAAEGWNV